MAVSLGRFYKKFGIFVKRKLIRFVIKFSRDFERNSKVFYIQELSCFNLFTFEQFVKKNSDIT